MFHYLWQAIVVFCHECQITHGLQTSIFMPMGLISFASKVYKMWYWDVLLHPSSGIGVGGCCTPYRMSHRTIQHLFYCICLIYCILSWSPAKIWSPCKSVFQDELSSYTEVSMKQTGIPHDSMTVWHPEKTPAFSRSLLSRCEDQGLRLTDQEVVPETVRALATIRYLGLWQRFLLCPPRRVWYFSGILQEEQ